MAALSSDMFEFIPDRWDKKRPHCRYILGGVVWTTEEEKFDQRYFRKGLKVIGMQKDEMDKLRQSVKERELQIEKPTAKILSIAMSK